MGKIESEPFEAFGLERGDKEEPGDGRLERPGRRRQAIELQAQAAMIRSGLVQRIGVRRGHLLHMEVRQVLAAGDEQGSAQYRAGQDPEPSVSEKGPHGNWRRAYRVASGQATRP
jgi:hypothetical protein